MSSVSGILPRAEGRWDRQWAIAGSGLASTMIPVSLIWDYSWESSIGVDRVWSPPHLATHLAVWLAAAVGLQCLLACKLARRRGETVVGVSIGPFCAPAGAWVLLWAAALFEAVFPLDVWWQQAYGLGAGLWPPPQILKATSFLALQFGSLMFAANFPNPPGARGRWLNWNCGMVLALTAIMLGTATLPNSQHSAPFYKLCAAVFPVMLVMASVVGPGRWNATLAALAYLGVSAVMVWLLPLFPGRPLTSPIHNPMDHLMPPRFPLLLVAPAMAIDLVRRSAGWARSWKSEIGLALAAGLVFVAAFLPAQWWFAAFLLSPAADNGFFAGGGRHWPFFLKIDDARVMFWRGGDDALTWPALAAVFLLAAGSAFVGQYAGKFLRAWRR